ncbi:sigma-70 family RNA polymerase sigma factor [Cellulomonas humilata]|uniref:RNA polymerase sigma factor n=1 Tax=Cellulomonas humilata TaxID=144055 RepID=A0A7Y5ZXZ4_9CELL|nr:sigma-70 family RNA polymerase sigma factor [Cellulomonas humilata]NUU16196.1 sigma-70 family RNA polymerase sigma factor [Cellulomonas humilata]
MSFPPDTATVVAARDGDPEAVDRLVAGYLPLVYAIVGRALRGHADVDDVVQDTMLRALRGLGDLRDPAAFRSWLVAIAVRQVRERHRVQGSAPDPLPEDDRDPGADFTDLAILRLELTGQRRETAEATRWLDEDDRELLSLWWLEASGELTRPEIVDALDVTPQHAAVRIQRMKGQLETARVVVRALAASPPCIDLLAVTTGWDGRPAALWRKRIARHTRECPQCAPAWHGLVPADRLLVGVGLAPVPFVLSALRDGVEAAGSSPLGTPAAGGHAATGHGLAGKLALVGGTTVGRGILVAALVTATVAGVGTAVAGDRRDGQRAQAAVTRTPTPTSSSVEKTAAPTPDPTLVTPEVVAPAPEVAAPVVETPAEAPPVATPVQAAATSAKKGVATWQFDGLTGALDDVGAGWYYNWSASNADMPGPDDVEFVPMIWGRDSVTDANLAKATAEGSTLLGFNEPDLAEQSGMGVEEALAAWPRLEATGMRLGSPAVAWGGNTPGGWLDRFMTGAHAQGRRVDFITLHWYGSDFSDAAVGHFLGYVDAVHERYGLPIWVTEYGLLGGGSRFPTGAQAAAFIEGSTAGMESRPYVERYAWFGLPAVGDSVAFGLYTDATTPTEAGRAYRAAGS